MQQYVCKIFDVPRLLAMGIVDVRAVAAQNGGLPARAYFSRLERFLGDAPRLTAIVMEGDAGQLEELGRTLGAMGCAELQAAVQGLDGGSRAGREAVAARIAQLCQGLQSVYRSRRRGGGAAEEDDPVSLADALAFWDHEEAHRKLRVLAVDDVAVVLNTITAALSQDYEVFALKRAAQVEAFLAHTTPELFLLDIEMPELSGYDLVSVIRSFPQHRDTPIIFLTGNATAQNIKTAVALGASDFITKPVNREVLREKIAGKIVWKKAF